MSELPRMYHNKIDKDLNNNERVFSTLDSNNIYTNSFIKNRNNLTVEPVSYTHLTLPTTSRV